MDQLRLQPGFAKASSNLQLSIRIRILAQIRTLLTFWLQEDNMLWWSSSSSSCGSNTWWKYTIENHMTFPWSILVNIPTSNKEEQNNVAWKCIFGSSGTSKVRASGFVGR